MSTTTIKARCDHCSEEVQLSATAFRLTIFEHSGVGYYEFFCDLCHEPNKKEADAHVVSLLRSGGVHQQIVMVPAEYLEAKGGPPISIEDVSDFIIDLNTRNDDLCELLAHPPVDH